VRLNPDAAPILLAGTSQLTTASGNQPEPEAFAKRRTARIRASCRALLRAREVVDLPGRSILTSGTAAGDQHFDAHYQPPIRLEIGEPLRHLVSDRTALVLGKG
jgi:hypothetical protein